MTKNDIQIPLPAGGLNCIDDSLIGDSECAEGTKNFSFKNGIPQTRKGYVKSSSFLFVTQPKTLINYINTGIRILLVACGTSLLKQNVSSFDVVGTIATDRIETLNYSCKFNDPDTYSDKLLVLDGTDYQYYNNGTSLASIPAYAPTADEIIKYGDNVLTTAPNEIKQGMYLVNDDNRIWIAYKNQVRLSHLDKPDYFPSTQVWKTSTGETVSGLGRFLGEVFIFTEHGCTFISGSTPDFTLPDHYIRKDLPIGYGCSQHRSIVVGGNAIIWANRHGVYRYKYLPTGYSVPECISESQVAVQLKGGLTQVHTRSVNKIIQGITDWSKVFATYYDEEYRLYMGNKQVLVYDTIGDTWALYEYNQEFNCGTTWEDKLYYAAAYLYNTDYDYDPNSTNYDGLSDDGQPIEFRIKSKYFDFGKAANLKKFRKFFFSLYNELLAYDITLNVNIDNDYMTIPGEIYNKPSRMGELAFGDKITTKGTNLNFPIKLHHKGKKYNIQYELVCNQLNAAFALKSIVLLLSVKELK